MLYLVQFFSTSRDDAEFVCFFRGIAMTMLLAYKICFDCQGSSATASEEGDPSKRAIDDYNTQEFTYVNLE